MHAGCIQPEKNLARWLDSRLHGSIAMLLAKVKEHVHMPLILAFWSKSGMRPGPSDYTVS